MKMNMRIYISYVTEYESLHNISDCRHMTMFLYSENGPNRKFSCLYVCVTGNSHCFMRVVELYQTSFGRLFVSVKT